MSGECSENVLNVFPAFVHVGLERQRRRHYGRNEIAKKLDEIA